MFKTKNNTPAEQSMPKAKTTKSKKRKHTMPPVPKSFPLYPHASGKWLKVVSGKPYYFGNWGRIRGGVMVRMPDDGKTEALALYQAFIADPNAIRVSDKVAADQVTVAILCNSYLTAKLNKVKAGDIKATTYNEAEQGTDYIVSCFGNQRLVSELGPTDFTKLLAVISEGRCLNSRAGLINKIKSVFKYGLENDLINRNVRYGSEFKAPKKDQIETEHADDAVRLFKRDEILRILDAANTFEKCVTLLGINCALGATDIGHLRLRHIDFENLFLTFPRVKNGRPRRCKMWLETAAAIKEWLLLRPEPQDKKHADLVFLNRRGLPVVRDNSDWRGEELVGVSHVDGVGPKFQRLLQKLKINGRRRLGHYTLRHQFRSVADGSLDFPAVRLVMGHASKGMDGVYTKWIDEDRDARLTVVANHVHAWLFTNKKGGAK